METISPPKTKRYDCLDIARGLAILLVIVGHSPYVPGFVADFVYGFHMPLFFFVSGLFIGKHLTLPFRDFLRKKAKAYLLPYFSYSLAKECFYILAKRYVNPFRYLGIFVQWPGTTLSNPLWFLTALFAANLLFYFIWHLSLRLPRWKPFWSAWILAAGALIFHEEVAMPLPWYLDVACIVLPYVTFGWWISQKGLSRFVEKLNLKNTILTFLVTAAAIKIYGFTEGTRIFYNSCDLHDPIFGYLAGFSGTLLLCCLGQLLRKSRVLRYIGHNSLFYYLFHLRGVSISRKITGMLSMTNPMLMLLSDLIFAMVIPLPIIFLIKNYFYLFFGLPKPQNPFHLSDLFRKKLSHLVGDIEQLGKWP